MIKLTWVQGTLPDQDNLEGPIQKVSTETVLAPRGTIHVREVDTSLGDLSGMVISSAVVALATVVMYRRIVNLLF